MVRKLGVFLVLGLLVLSLGGFYAWNNFVDRENIITGEVIAASDCEAVSGEISYGVFSMKNFNDKLFIGQFGYGFSSQSMLHSYPNWQKVTPGITGVSESVCVLEEFNGKLYANTEADGRVYQSSSDGSSWSKVYTSPSGYTVGCGLEVFNGAIYAIHADYINFNSKIIRSSDGTTWQNVKTVGSYIREIVVYNGKLYTFGVKSSKQGVMYVSSDGTNWQEFNAPARFFRATAIGDKLYLGSTKKYSNGISGLWVYDGTNFNILSEQDTETISKPQLFKSAVFVGTSSGFNTGSGPSYLMKYTSSGLQKVCTFAEQGIWSIEVSNGSLYIGTWNYNGNAGKVYRYNGEVTSSTTYSNCSYTTGSAQYTGINNTIGLNNGDTRFLCLSGKFYECGWTLTNNNFAYEAANNEVIGNYRCDLANKKWKITADCGVKLGSVVHTGINNTIGLNNGDTRFLCLSNRLYECGWNLTYNNFAYEAADDFVVGNYRCDLANSKWVL